MEMSTLPNYKHLSSLERLEISKQIRVVLGRGNPEEGSCDFDKPVWFLEYSVSQNSFHVDHINKIKYWNVEACISGRPLDYIIIDGPMLFDELMPALHEFEFLIKLNHKYGRKP